MIKCVSLILIFYVATVTCEINLKTFDWSSVKPLYEIIEWQKVHSNFIAPPANAHPTARSPRIIDGDIAGAVEFPYLAGVLLHFDTGNSFCGGTLITRRFVLTAANCVHLVPSASVLLGASDMMRQIEMNIDVTRIRVHPQYSHSQSANDIATLELNREAVLSSTINLVRLPNRRQAGQAFLNQLGTVAGWGRVQSGNQPIPTQFLKYMRSPVISNLACRIRYPAFITDTNICADPSIGTPCNGDEGGPLMITDADGRRTQIGIFSYQFSLGCGLGWPAVFARVTEFLDFIEQNSDVRILENFE